MILVAPPRQTAAPSPRARSSRTARHATIGVFAALSVATACLLPEGPAREVAQIPDGAPAPMLVEHPTGASPVLLTVEARDGREDVTEGAIISTARALFAGEVLVPSGGGYPAR